MQDSDERSHGTCRCPSLLLADLYIPMLKKGMISAIGSDLHGVKGYNYFRSAVKHMGSDITEKVMSSTEKLLENAKIYG